MTDKRLVLFEAVVVYGRVQQPPFSRNDSERVSDKKHFASFVAIDKGCRGVLPGQRITRK